MLYGLCQSTYEKQVKEAGATYKVGKAVIVDCGIFEKYLENFRIPADKVGMEQERKIMCQIVFYL